MRILAIRGARLASLEAPFEVDLTVEPLRSAGVFAIVGPTGAGKSSLLDALCLALFDTTPRLERTPRVRLEDDLGDDDLSGRDARTLVRRGAKDAFAEVDFAGADGRTYRARWSVERGRTGRLRSAQLTLRDVASGRGTAGTKGEVLAAIEAKLGIGLAELRRAVLLPQGEIAAFLDAPSDERALLLERLTGAEIFGEVSRVVHERAQGARRARENVEVTLGMLPLLDSEDVARLEESVLVLRLDGARAEERTAALVAHRERVADHARLAREEREARELLADVERQRDLAELTRDEVALADRAERAAPELAQLRRARDAEQAVARQHEDESTAHGEALAAIVPLAAEAARLDAERVETAEAHARARTEADRALAALRDEIAALDPSVASELDAMRARERALGALLRSLDRWRHLSASEQRAMDEARQAREVGQTAARQAERQDARALEIALDAASQAARLDEARRASERLVVARSLEAHRACLVDGAPCPLCGAIEHPHAARGIAPLVTEAEARLATIHLALERTRATLARVQSAADAARRENAASCVRERAARDEGEVGRVAAARIEVELRQETVRLGLVQLGLVQGAPPLPLGPELADELGRASSSVLARGAVLEAAIAHERAARETLSRLEGEARAREAYAVRACEAAGARAEAAARAHDRAAERERALRESVARHADSMALARAARASAERALDVALAEARVLGADAERVLGADRVRIARLRSELGRIDRERASARTRVDERESRRADAEARLAEVVASRVVAEGGEALDAEIAAARHARDDARRREATAATALAHDRASRERALELEGALRTALCEEERWAGLDALVGSADGKRFRAHAQSITLERLVGFANVELAHLAPRFTLARAPLAGDLALCVVDGDAGHARRTVQSLSGGESFLVSLALALGLAAMTAAEGGRGTLSASSLFLDEGLGALDPASLEIALAALEALRASGRQIAIVTHVPHVAERFAARVEVVPRGAGRSDVRVLRA